MTHYEMAEKLSEKMGVTLEQATAALEACDWEMLDAALQLERELGEARQAAYSTEAETPKDEGAETRKARGKNVVRSLGTLIRDAVNNGCKVGFAGNCPVDGARYLRYPMLSSDEHYKQIMKGFAALRISDGISIKMMVQDDIDAGLNNAEIILLTTYVDDELDDRLRVLKQYNNAVSVIHLSEEDLKE